MNKIDHQQKIYVAGHNGLVGSSIVRALKAKGYSNIITRSHNELELTNQNSVNNFFLNEKPDHVYLAAGRVGGIHANNTYPAEFIYENIMIVSNIINAAFENNVKKLLYLGSSCVYPKYAKQPMSEDALLSGFLEPTNEPYAIAKIAGLKLCESYNRQFGISHSIDYRCVMPTNLYGPGDNYHPDNSHVIPALIRRFHEAKVNNISSVKIWGSGNPKREFLYVEDLASACILVMNIDKEMYEKHTQPMCSHINIGSGSDMTIKELAQLISKIVGFNGKIEFGSSKLDGTPRKLIENSRLNALGWKPEVSIEEGLRRTYREFCAT